MAHGHLSRHALMNERHLSWRESLSMRRRAIGRGYARYLIRTVLVFGGVWAGLCFAFVLCRWLTNQTPWWHINDLLGVRFAGIAGMGYRLLLEVMGRTITLRDGELELEWVRQRIDLSGCKQVTISPIGDGLVRVELIHEGINGELIFAAPEEFGVRLPPSGSC